MASDIRMPLYQQLKIIQNGSLGHALHVAMIIGWTPNFTQLDRRVCRRFTLIEFGGALVILLYIICIFKAIHLTHSLTSGATGNAVMCFAARTQRVQLAFYIVIKWSSCDKILRQESNIASVIRNK